MNEMDRRSRSVCRPAAALLGVLLWVSASQAQLTPPKIVIEDVIPQGNQQVPAARIMGILKTKPGSEYDQAVLYEDVRRLYQTNLFRNIEVREQALPENKVRIHFLISEYPSAVQEVVFQGAKHIKQEELETITGIRRGTPLNPIANQMARQAILRKYREMGRMLAGVELLEGDKPGDTRVVFSITEGPKVKVSSIKFEGNSFVSGGRLNTQVDTSRQFLGLFGGDFEPAKADHDCAKLEEYYKSNGYLEAKVSRELRWDEDQRHVTLVFHVDEGDRFRVAATQVEGNKIYSDDKLLATAALRPGEFYNKNKAIKDQGAIQAIYGYGGYGVSVHEQDYYPAPGQVAVHYEVQERPPARVKEVLIVGNEWTRDNVIRRQVPLYPGQLLTYPKLREAERNLARLNIFDMNPATGVRPTVSVLDPDGDSEFKDILVNLNETQTGSFIIGAGINSDAGVNVNFALNERNFDICRVPTSFEELLSGHAFRGAGQEFRAEAVPGNRLQRYTMNWREPSLLDSPYGLGVGLYYYNRVYNEYTESRLGSRVVVDRRLNQYWRVSGTVRLEQVGVFDVPYYAPADILDAKGSHFLAGFRGSVTRDSRDSYLRPTEGSLVEVSFEQFLGDYTFPQVNVEGNKYFTTYERADGSGRHVLALRSQAGWTGSNTPVFERFYAGGFRSMRGFEFRGVGPDERGFKVGGDFMFLNSIEYQIPILANDQLYAVLFADSGTVESDFSLKNYRVSVGAGLRIVVPMLGPVPIALDFGFPIVKAPGDQDQVFSFWVGFFH